MLIGDYHRKKHAGESFLGSGQEIYEHIIKPLVDIRRDVLSVQVLHGDRRSCITVLIDFVEYTRSILLVKWPITNPDNVIKAINMLVKNH